MKFLYSLIIIAYALAGFSQAPGYMGKRFSAGYGFYASPGFIGSHGLTKVNMLHEGFIEFAAKKNFSLGFSVRYYNAQYSNERDVKISGFDLPIDNSNYSYQQLDGNPSGITNIKGLTYTLYGKFFKKKYLAPWGRYFLLGVTLNTYVASYDPDQMYVPFEKSNGNYGEPRKNYYFTDFGPTQQSFKKIDVMIGNGRSRIIANRIILDYGYNINLWAATTAIFDLNDEPNNTFNASEYISGVSKVRVRAVNRFNVFIKVGVLLF